jgi:hypothetical protein
MRNIDNILMHQKCLLKVQITKAFTLLKCSKESICNLLKTTFMLVYTFQKNTAFAHDLLLFCWKIRKKCLGFGILNFGIWWEKIKILMNFELNFLFFLFLGSWPLSLCNQSLQRLRGQEPKNSYINTVVNQNKLNCIFF